jgi:hypothetical protein
MFMILVISSSLTSAPAEFGQVTTAGGFIREVLQNPVLVQAGMARVKSATCVGIEGHGNPVRSFFVSRFFLDRFFRIC